MFVLKGTRSPLRTIAYRGTRRTQTIFECLPAGSLVSMRDDNAGVNKRNFLEWARAFVTDVAHLTRDGRKVLLIYDGYRSHMSPAVLRLFRKRNIVAYCLPAHTTGVTQPLDLTVFGSFKTHLAETLRRMHSAGNADARFDVFDFCRMMREAYVKSFTPDTIMGGFRRAGLHPLNPSTVLSLPMLDSSGR